MKLWMMNRLVNPIVRMILRSPVHRLLSGSFAVMTYTGRKSGRRHSLPVMYAERTGELVVFAGRPREKRWWRNLRGGALVEIVLRGRRLEGRAEAILDDSAAIERARQTYAAKFPKAAAGWNAGEEAVFVRIDLFRKRSPNA
jgi:hypothetical protein